MASVGTTGRYWALRVGSLLVLLALGCGCGGKLQNMSDAELRRKASECRGKLGKRKAVVCHEVRKECGHRGIC